MHRLKFKINIDYWAHFGSIKKKEIGIGKLLIEEIIEESQAQAEQFPRVQPWKNGYIESFHYKFRDECLQRECFQSLLEAQVMIEDWRALYNTHRTHSSLAYQTPAAFAAQYPTKPAETLTPVVYKK